MSVGSSLFNQNKATGGKLPFGATRPQQGSLFGGSNLLQSQQQLQQQPKTAVNIFSGGAGDKPTAPAQLQFGTPNKPQGSNFFGGGSALASTTATATSSAFSFTAAGSSGQSSLLPAQGSVTPSFQFGASSNQPAALAQQGTNLFGAQSQQQAMSGFSFSLGNTQKQQPQQQPSFQLSGAASGVGGKTGGFNFTAAKQNPFNLSGGQQQKTASFGGSGGFNFSAAAAQSPSFNFMAGSGGVGSGPATSKPSSRSTGRRKSRK